MKREYGWAAETVVLRRTVNPFLNGNTGGSNPSPPTTFADVAQLVERTLHTGMVTGSSPVFGTNAPLV